MLVDGGAAIGLLARLHAADGQLRLGETLPCEADRQSGAGLITVSC